MKWLAAIGLASLMAMTAATQVEAREGCGGGFHRGYYGRCKANVHDRVRPLDHYHRHGGDVSADRFRQHSHSRRHHDWTYRPLHPQ
jgi:hypothetical protein